MPDLDITPATAADRVSAPVQAELVQLTEDTDWEALALRFGGRLVNVEDPCGEQTTELRIGTMTLTEGSAIAVLPALAQPPAPSGGPCPACHGDTVLYSPAWRLWRHRHDTAHDLWQATAAPEQDWFDTATYRDLEAEQPLADQPEEEPCPTCLQAGIGDLPSESIQTASALLDQARHHLRTWRQHQNHATRALARQAVRALGDAATEIADAAGRLDHELDLRTEPPPQLLEDYRWRADTGTALSWRPQES